MDAQKDKPDKDKPDEHKHVQVEVHNEDDGSDYRFNAEREDTLQSVIDVLYVKKLRRERRDGDRLRCEDGGANVFDFAGQTFDQYLDAGQCKDLVWLFAGQTGGA